MSSLSRFNSAKSTSAQISRERIHSSEGTPEASTPGGGSFHEKGGRPLHESLQAAASWLRKDQHTDGFWCGELEGDSILESEYILLLGWLDRQRTEVAKKAARYLLQQQIPTGGWALYPGGPLDLSASVKAYFALKLTGHDPHDVALERARRAILAEGGADKVNSFTRFYLALLGQIDYEHCPAVPPEMVLLPNWSPVNIYRISAWSRTILVPLSVMWAYRPKRNLLHDFGIRELFLQAPNDWPPLRCPQPASDAREPRWKRARIAGWETVFRGLDRSLKLAERARVRPLRKRALAAAERWILERLDESDGLGAIFPPIIWSVVALCCRGYDPESEVVQGCLHELDKLMIEESDTIRLEPCKSPVWDTALSTRALAASAGPETDTDLRGAVENACRWLLSKEVRRRGDWSVSVAAEPAGWFFEHRNAFYPDVDDTIMVMMAFHEASRRWPDQAGQQQELMAACQRGLRWVLAMQNRDGGWGAFDRDNDAEFLCHVPFADHNAMIDPSTPDITARVLEAMSPWGMKPDDGPITRAVRYLRSTQEPDGSWFGRWGVNHIYGTWQVLTGLAAAGVHNTDPMVEAGVQWILSHQQSCGGWGESPDSYGDPSRRGKGPTTASQTAWALLGLMAMGHGDRPSVERGIDYLLRTQQADGTWHEAEFTGTGFPLVFYLRYHLYPIYFPILALANWRDATSGRGQTPEVGVG